MSACSVKQASRSIPSRRASIEPCASPSIQTALSGAVGRGQPRAVATLWSDYDEASSFGGSATHPGRRRGHPGPRKPTTGQSCAMPWLPTRTASSRKPSLTSAVQPIFTARPPCGALSSQRSAMRTTISWNVRRANDELVRRETQRSRTQAIRCAYSPRRTSSVYHSAAGPDPR